MNWNNIMTSAAAPQKHDINQQVWATSPAKEELQPFSKSLIFATSGLGGCLGWVVVHPANTVAVRWNLQPTGTTFNFMTMIRNTGGWMGLYDGLGAGLLRQVFYASTRFGLFETFRDKLHEIRGKTDFASRYVLPHKYCDAPRVPINFSFHFYFNHGDKGWVSER
jgi:hypothetical protein